MNARIMDLIVDFPSTLPKMASPLALAPTPASCSPVSSSPQLSASCQKALHTTTEILKQMGDDTSWTGWQRGWRWRHPDDMLRVVACSAIFCIAFIVMVMVRVRVRGWGIAAFVMGYWDIKSYQWDSGIYQAVEHKIASYNQKISIDRIGMGCSDSRSISIPTHVQPVHAPTTQAHLPPACSAIPLENGSRFQTLVIGGGIGGVAAACELAKAGQKVGILEANNYLGGRMKSTPIQLLSGGSVQFDEGASWIHGSCKVHPITKLAKSVQGVVMKQTDDDSIDVYDEKGEEVDKQVDKAYKMYEKILEKCEDQQPQHPMQEAFKKRGAPLNDKYFMFHVSNDIEFQTSGSIAELAANAQDDQQYNGKQMLVLSGYQKFVQSLPHSCQSQLGVEVYLNQKVKKIVWKSVQGQGQLHGQGQSQIVCTNGVRVFAKNVVIAVPIGILKSKQIQFCPPLPQWKNEAITSIGFGNVCKILIEFPNNSFIKIKTHYIGVVSDNVHERGLATYFLNLQPLAGVPALMTFGLGSNADQAEMMPQNELKYLLARRMSAFAEEKISSEDFKIYRTYWRGNENFGGTYSYASTKTRPKHWQNMAKPIFNTNWYFCGEHCTSKYRGTVHGAYLSGLSTASWINKKVADGEWIYPDFKKTAKKKQQSSSSSSN